MTMLRIGRHVTPRAASTDPKKKGAEAFRGAAARQDGCQHPNHPPRHDPRAAVDPRGWDAHHVLYEQHCKTHGAPRFDPANALKLCKGCHRRHHDRSDAIPGSALPEAAREFMRLHLGEGAAEVYLGRYYPEPGEEPLAVPDLPREQEPRKPDLLRPANERLLEEFDAAHREAEGHISKAQNLIDGARQRMGAQRGWEELADALARLRAAGAALQVGTLTRYRAAKRDRERGSDV